MLREKDCSETHGGFSRKIAVRKDAPLILLSQESAPATLAADAAAAAVIAVDERSTFHSFLLIVLLSLSLSFT